MGYREWRVAPDVDVWSADAAAGTLRILPDGCLDLIFDGRGLVVAGPDAVARVHTSAVPVSRRAVRLHAGRGAVLLGVPAHELVGRSLPLAEVWGERRAHRLTSLVSADPLGALRRWALAGDADVLACRLVGALRGGATIARAAHELSLSPRQLQRRSRHAFGYGPAHLARVLRLQRAVTADARRPWAEVAHATGFSDQAHLTHEFRALAGTTPGALRAERVRSVQDAA